MISVDTLKEKLAKYLQQKKEIESGEGRAEEIERKVEEYRQKLIEDSIKEDEEDLAKINSYIEVITDLINEDKMTDLRQPE